MCEEFISWTNLNPFICAQRDNFGIVPLCTKFNQNVVFKEMKFSPEFWKAAISTAAGGFATNTNPSTMTLGGTVIAAVFYYQNHKDEFESSINAAILGLLKNLRSEKGVFFVHPPDSPTYKRVDTIMQKVVTAAIQVSEREKQQSIALTHKMLKIGEHWYDPIVQNNTSTKLQRFWDKAFDRISRTPLKLIVTSNSEPNVFVLKLVSARLVVFQGFYPTSCG
jgi:hypothetical protein